MLYRLAYSYPDGKQRHGFPMPLDVVKGWVEHYRKSPIPMMNHWVEESEDGAEWQRTKTMPTELDDLRAQLAAEREAHAAEVGRLRSELSAARESFEEIDCGDAQCQSQYDGCDQACRRRAYKAAQRIEAALAAPPTAAVEAVKGMRVALEATICGACGNRIGWQGDFDAEQRRLGRSDWRTCTGCRDTRAALAAWKEATNG